MRTREEVEDLKARWLKDPCWDIESADSFGEYAVELADFAEEHHSLWQAAREKAEAKAYRDTPAGDATLRDIFATQAMQGELASTEDTWEVVTLACRAYQIADAMMAERREEG